MAENADHVDSEPTVGFGANFFVKYEDVNHCYRVLLGRSPENLSVIEEALSQPIHTLFRAMLESSECIEVYKNLTLNQRLPHYFLSTKPEVSDLIWIDSFLKIDEKFQNDILSSENWEQLLTSILLRQEVSNGAETLVSLRETLSKQRDPTIAFLESSKEDSVPSETQGVICVLDEASSRCVKGWAAFADRQDRPIALQISVDGIVLSELRCELIRSDVAREGYPGRCGCMSALPLSYFDGEEHTLRFLYEGHPVEMYVQGNLQKELRFSEVLPPTLRSNVDGYSHGIIKGWVLLETREKSLRGGLTVQVEHSGQTVALVRADRYRPDVANVLQADAYCGFIFEPPHFLRRGSPVEFRFYEAQHKIELANSPYTSSLGNDLHESKLLRIQEEIGRLSVSLSLLKEEIRSTITRPHYDIDNYGNWFEVYLHDLRRRVAESRTRTPRLETLVSVICPTYRPGLPEFKLAVASVLNQTYKNLELIIINDCSRDDVLRQYLSQLQENESRVRVFTNETNFGISNATNVGIDAAKGEWIAFFDHDDVMEDVALECMMAAASESDALVVYSDEDKISLRGEFTEPNFKPDWNYRLLLSNNYICHLLLAATHVVREAGKLRKECDGAQDHDLLLRMCLNIEPRQIVHVPEVLYHWRQTPNSTAAVVEAKPYTVEAGRKAISDHLAQKGVLAEVKSVRRVTLYSIEYKFPTEPKVVIVIPFRDQADMTERCILAVTSQTAYQNFEIILVDNWSTSSQAEAFVNRVKSEKVKVLRVEEQFNYSRLNNIAVEKTVSEYLFFMNNDLFVKDPNWLRTVVNEAMADPRVGIVGGKFLYPNHTVQHTGVILGLWGVAGHANLGVSPEAPGYVGRAIVAQELSAVTAAGMLVRRQAFEEVDGFDEHNLKVAFNDIDLCLRINRAGYKIVWTPEFIAEHHESISRGSDDRPVSKPRFEAEVDYMKRTWNNTLKNDPHYSRFFDRFGEPFRDLIDPDQKSM